MDANKSNFGLVRLAARALLLCALCGCAQPLSQPSSGAVVAQPADIQPAAMSPINTWRFDEAETARQIQDAFFQSLELPFDAPDAFLAPLIEEELGVHAAMENVSLFKETAASTNNALNGALSSTRTWFKTQFQNAASGVAGKLECSLTGSMDWRSMLAFLRTCALTGQPSKALFEQALKVDVFASFDQATATVHARLDVSVLEFRQMWSRCAGSARNDMTGKLAYAYLLTVYNDAGKMRSYREPKDAARHLSNIVSPLKRGNIRKTWFAGRDNGTRRHTGTDILAPEDTPILSCTDGVVSTIAYGTGAGNYVVVTDAQGYEFHYYHMVRLTDFLSEGERVKAGELIGHVGNTGNSSANHLHLSIIHPNGQYVNPYPYLVAAAK